MTISTTSPQPIWPGNIFVAIQTTRTIFRPRARGSTATASASAGGCDFPVDPSLEATRAEVWWRPEVDAELIQLQPAAASGGTRLHGPAARAAGEAWWSVGRGRDKIRLALLASGADPGQPLAAVVPLDAATPSRLRALARLWRHLEGAPAPPDPITLQRRRRMKAMLRAIDARAHGAAHREIAGALYGAARVAAEPWKTSALRDATLRLVRDGGAMVRGGYRALLGPSSP